MQLFPAPSASPFAAMPMRPALALLKGTAWVEGPHPGLVSRDLMLGQASGGQIDCQHHRATAAGHAASWPGAGEPGLRFLFVTRGRIVFTRPEGAEVPVETYDTILQDGLTDGSAAAWSADFEAIEIAAPAAAHAGRRPPPHELVSYSGPGSVIRDVPASYRAGQGPRRFMVYRDTGLMALTGGRMHLHLVRAIDTPEGGTGWHVHSMSQIFVVTRGWVDIAVDGDRGAETVRMVAGDAMCIAAGQRHNVFAFSGDYDVLELCLPGEYSTEPTPAPDARSA